jgi:hypothetical protein
LWCKHLTVAREAEGLAVSWNTANDAVLAEGKRVLIDDPHRFDAVRVIGVDGEWLSRREPTWRRAVEVVAMDGFTGSRTATAEALPHATAIMDPTRSTRPAESCPIEINGRLEHLRGLCSRVPQPHQLRRPIPTGDRRIPTPTTRDGGEL